MAVVFQTIPNTRIQLRTREITSDPQGQFTLTDPKEIADCNASSMFMNVTEHEKQLAAQAEAASKATA